MKVAVSQLICVLVAAPVFLGFSKAWEDYGDDPLSDKKEMNYFEFVGHYLTHSFSCIFDFHPDSSKDNEQCAFSFLFVLGYAFSILFFQIALAVLMQQRQTLLAKRTLAFAVPITVLAFCVGHLLMPNTISLTGLDGFEIVSLFFSTMGVGIYNWFDSHPNDPAARNPWYSTNANEKRRDTGVPHFHNSKMR